MLQESSRGFSFIGLSQGTAGAASVVVQFDKVGHWLLLSLSPANNWLL